MPEVVEAYIRQYCFLEERFELGCGDVAEIQELDRHGAEDKAIVLPKFPKLEPFGVLSRLVCLEHLYGALCEPNAAALWSPLNSNARQGSCSTNR